MAHTPPTQAQIKSLLDTTYAKDAGYDAFIATANIVVDEDLAQSGLSDNRKTQIALFLAAHFATLTIEKGGVRGAEVGNTDQEFKYTTGAGYTQTRFGQQAITLDTSGTLARNAEPKMKAELRVVGGTAS